jgi:hypothetical protein
MLLQIPLQHPGRQTMPATKFAPTQPAALKLLHQPFDLLPTSSLPLPDFFLFVHPFIAAQKPRNE